MFYEFVAVVAAAFAAAGSVMLLRRWLPVLPKWWVPAAAGAAMLGMTLFNEYSWFERTRAALPEGMVVAGERAERSWLRPWTYVWPITTRFMALDQAHAQWRAQQVLIDHYLFARWQAPKRITSLYDCARARRADVTASVDWAEDGRVQGVQWREMPSDHAALTAACAAREGRPS